MRDKVISIRVNSELLSKVQAVIDSKTEVTKCLHRTYYRYYDESHPLRNYDKFTLADLFEEKLREYLAEQNTKKK